MGMAGRAVLAFLLFGATPAFTQPSGELENLRREVEALKEWQGRMQRELQELKSLVGGRQARPAAPAAETQSLALSIDGAPFKGETKARLTLIEFSDYQCPFCARHVRETLPQIERDYISTGKVKYVVRDFPIESIHPQAFRGHEAAHCAGEQGRYWEMHARLFANQGAMGPNDLVSHARTLGLNLPVFQQCVESGKYSSGIRKAFAEGQTAGVTGTPTFFLGFTDSDGLKVKAVRMIRGAQPFSVFKEVIDSLLDTSAK